MPPLQCFPTFPKQAKPHIHLMVEHTLLLLFLKPSLLAYFIIAILVDIVLIKTGYYQRNLFPCLVRLIANVIWRCMLLLGVLREQAIYIVLIVEMFKGKQRRIRRYLWEDFWHPETIPGYCKGYGRNRRNPHDRRRTRCIYSMPSSVTEIRWSEWSFTSTVMQTQ